MKHFETITHIAAPPAVVFDLSLDVDLHTASMARSGERIIGGVRTGCMALGDQVTWEARHFGIKWRMTSRISAYEKPGSFVDEQVAGPFRRWHHTHRFVPDGRGGTVMHDGIRFAAPFGLLGAAVETVVLARYMRNLILARNVHVKQRAEEAARTS
ncbi:cyclase [Streptomyces sp. SID4919]|uniref:SRPBCC family protein n=1 Tax=unclassified Streptomyces TaxID=2593676 RepID=UPI000823EE32|nr:MULTISPECIES: SRPBCC family protein [unclassified Streptomyces]MYY10654.1 cyclase [Streptomyces sp. SID4919]SCK62893.1 Ligand-binding SRPBCC domain-containing protein [Streptomyces sp. AmelKG-E11A]